MQNAHFRAYQELLGLALPGEFQDGSGAADEIGGPGHFRPALEVDQNLRPGVGLPGLLQFFQGEAAVGDALPFPGDDLLVSEAGHEARQVPVRYEKDAAVGQGLNNLYGVAGGAADVALRLDLRRGIDVADHRRVGIFALFPAEALRVNAVGQRAAGQHIGQQDDLFRRQNAGRLGHEADPGQDYYPGLGSGGIAAESQGIADKVSYVLHLVLLVVVSQNNGLPLSFETLDFSNQSVHIPDRFTHFPSPLINYSAAAFYMITLRSCLVTYLVICLVITAYTIIRVYERCGVREYWVVDTEEKSVEVYALKEGKFELAQRAEGSGQVSSGVIEGFAVSLESIFS